jgi:hypothetical protein
LHRVYGVALETFEICSAVIAQNSFHADGAFWAAVDFHLMAPGF